MSKEFKVCDKCKECAKYKKECKGYEFSIKVESFYCTKFKIKEKK